MKGRTFSTALQLAGYFPKRVVRAPESLGCPAVADATAMFDDRDAAFAAAERFSIFGPEPGVYYAAEVLVAGDGPIATSPSPIP